MLVVTHIDCGGVSAALVWVDVEIIRGVVTVQMISVIGPCNVALLQAHIAALSSLKSHAENGAMAQRNNQGHMDGMIGHNALLHWEVYHSLTVDLGKDS